MDYFTVIAQNGERRNFKKKSLDEVCADVRKYNKKHGTNLSYGKYIAMRNNGLLKD